MDLDLTGFDDFESPHPEGSFSYEMDRISHAFDLVEQALIDELGEDVYEALQEVSMDDSLTDDERIERLREVID